MVREEQQQCFCGQSGDPPPGGSSQHWWVDCHGYNENYNFYCRSKWSQRTTTTYAIKIRMESFPRSFLFMAEAVATHGDGDRTRQSVYPHHNQSTMWQCKLSWNISIQFGTVGTTTPCYTLKKKARKQMNRRASRSRSTTNKAKGEATIVYGPSKRELFISRMQVAKLSGVHICIHISFHSDLSFELLTLRYAYVFEANWYFSFPSLMLQTFIRCFIW